MLRIVDRVAAKTCLGLSRSEVLRVGVLSLVGLALQNLLASRVAAATTCGVKERAVVVLLLQGGGPQIETFDPKMSAPAEFRNVTGEVQTKIPGVIFGETFPKRARMADLIAVVRNFTAGNGGLLDEDGYARMLVAGNSLDATIESLSSRAAEAVYDYEFLVKEGKGRRLFPAAPEHSILLRKAIGSMPHGAGKKLEPTSPYYQILRRWIEQGAPASQSSDPAVTKIEVFPKERLLDRNTQQQLLVVAHLTNGSIVDVTRMSQFECNQAELGEVSTTGLFASKQIPGSAAVMVRYQSHVDVFRGTVPLGAPVEHLPKTSNFIDELVFKRLKALGLPPSELCDDATFLRRVTIDIAGRLPTKTEAKEFLADEAADKRVKLVDRLLESKDYGYYFANKWSAVLRNRRRSANDDLKPTSAFHDWIRDSLLTNKPYDQFVREILTATGEEIKTPPVVWYRELKESSAVMEDTAQLFLGQRLACAKCHHHPFEKWSQQDYYGFTAFFAQLDVKQPKPAKKQKNMITPAEPASVLMKTGKSEIKNPRTGQMVPPTGLGNAPMTMASGEDPRFKLVEWMADPNNPFFARSSAGHSTLGVSRRSSATRADGQSPGGLDG